MCNMLISINPKYVESIFDGSKRYEYRKIKCKRNIDKIIIYSTFPIKKVVGEAKVEKILEGTPDKVWKETKMYSGIDLTFYNKYFKNKKMAIAYQLTDVRKYQTPHNLSDYGIKAAPQSFVYL